MRKIDLTRTGILLVGALAIAFFAVCGQKSGGGKTQAYEFELTTLDGDRISLSDFSGKALIVNVWDTWCPPCRREIPDFVELYTQYNPKGLEILGVTGGRSGVKAVQDFIKQFRIKYHNTLVTPDFVEGFGGIQSIPTTFVIDKKGYIYSKYVGYVPKETFENDIKAILAL